MAAAVDPGPGDGVVVRPAATVMVVRDGETVGASSIEVLMLRRNLRSDFVGGAYVFPGGGVEASDGGPEAAACSTGRSDADASRLLGVDSGGLAFWVAVVRECFEEAGLLLAYRAGGELLSLREPAERARFGAHRDAVNAGLRPFLEVCRAESLLLAADGIHYFAHWITPRGAPRRYDTRFFVTRAPEGQEAVHDAGETIADIWVHPADALERHREGEIDLILPTVKNLQAIQRFATAEDLVQAARTEADRVPTTEPRVVADGNGVRIVLPGDPAYDGAEVPQVRPDPGAPRDAAAMRDAIRRVSRAANEAPDGGPD